MTKVDGYVYQGRCMALARVFGVNS